MTKLEYLGAVIDWFMNNPRCVDELGCCHYQHNGGNCAVGLMMTDEDANNPDFLGFNVSDLPRRIIQGLDIQDLDFLEDVQKFHDYHSNWNETGLSENGEKHLEQLIEKYS